MFKNWNFPVSRPYCFFIDISNYMGPSYLYLNCYVIGESGYHSCSLKPVSTEYKYKIPM